MDKFRLVSPFKPTGDQPQAIAKLVEGKNIDEIEGLLAGIKCRNNTSCPDQLSKAIVEYKATKAAEEN